MIKWVLFGTGPGVGLQLGVCVLALMWAAGVHTLSVTQEPEVCKKTVGSGWMAPVELYSRAVHYDMPRCGPDACVLNRKNSQENLFSSLKRNEEIKM